MKNYVLTIWNFLDPIYFFFTRLTCLPHEGNILRIRVTKYKGKNIVLSDGTHINRNDLLIKIHLHNVKLLKELQEMRGELRKARRIFQYVQKSLPGVEGYLRNHHRTEEIKGVIGITALNKGCDRLGFEVIEISSPIYRWFKIFAFLPIEILSSKNTPISHILKQYKPRYIMMSANTLANRYRR